MSNIFFTSDPHFFHFNIIRLSNRPFQTLEEMHEAIIGNWNSKVNRGDDVYLLGDLGYSSAATYDELKKIRYRLNGKIHFVKGNHDIKNGIYKQPWWTEVNDYQTLKFDNKKIILFHYPILEWDGYFRESIHLFGHTHRDNVKLKGAINVGVDLHNFTPISYEEVLQLVDKQGPDYSRRDTTTKEGQEDNQPSKEGQSETCLPNR